MHAGTVNNDKVTIATTESTSQLNTPLNLHNLNGVISLPKKGFYSSAKPSNNMYLLLALLSQFPCVTITAVMWP